MTNSGIISNSISLKEAQDLAAATSEAFLRMGDALQSQLQGLQDLKREAKQEIEKMHADAKIQVDRQRKQADQDIQSEREKSMQMVEKERAKVEKDAKALEEEKKAMNSLCEEDLKGLVKLNVGGVIHTVKRSTLRQVEGSLLANMFSGRWEDSLEVDEDGRVFMDFDPKLFAIILNHFRHISYAKATFDEGLVDVKHLTAFRDLVTFLGVADVFVKPVPAFVHQKMTGREGAVSCSHCSVTLTVRYTFSGYCHLHCNSTSACIEAAQSCTAAHGKVFKAQSEQFRCVGCNAWIMHQYQYTFGQFIDNYSGYPNKQCHVLCMNCHKNQCNCCI